MPTAGVDTVSGQMSLPKLDRDPALAQRRTTPDYVADSLRAAIYSGAFGDGQELNQVELAEHFGVSRVPVREALRRLEAEGLVRLEAHRRAVVVGFNRERILEIFDLRGLIEGYLLERAAPNLDAERLDALRRMCDEMDRTRDHDAWLAKNRAFHEALYAPANATSAQQIVEQLTAQVERYLRRSDRSVERHREAGEEHRAIVEELAAGRVATARKVLQRHIKGSRDAIASRFAALDGAGAA